MWDANSSSSPFSSNWRTRFVRSVMAILSCCTNWLTRSIRLVIVCWFLWSVSWAFIMAVLSCSSNWPTRSLRTAIVCWFCWSVSWAFIMAVLSCSSNWPTRSLRTAIVCWFCWSVSWAFIMAVLSCFSNWKTFCSSSARWSFLEALFCAPLCLYCCSQEPLLMTTNLHVFKWVYRMKSNLN